MICSQCGTLNGNEREDCLRCHKQLHPTGMKGKIACTVHANREATTACVGCAVRLCAACAVAANGVDFCENCAPADAVRHDFNEDYERIAVVDPSRAARAGFGRRVIALVVDFSLLFFTSMIVGLVVFGFSGRLAFFLSPVGGGPAFYVFWFVVLLVSVAYASIMTSMTGQTLGKQVAGVIVLQPDGHILNLQTAVKRSLLAIPSAAVFGLGYLWAIWDADCETWHDKWAGTTVFLWEDVA